MKSRPCTASHCSRAFGRSLLLAACLLVLPASAPLLLAQQSTAGPASAAQLPPPPKAGSVNQIDQYIHESWATLSRSMSDCKSIVDPKIATPPLLYLPANVSMPPEVTRMQSQCNVRVQRLPHPITAFGQIKPSEIPAPGLLYLPNPYVVPGGRFNEMYGWDSYFIILGLLHDNHVHLARGMVENFFYEIENYGGLLNANRTYFFSRSQPPLLSSMILAVYQAMGNTPESRAWLTKAYRYADRDYSLWISDIHRASDTGLAHYFDIGEGPVPEMADDSTYYPDVIRWLVDHPDVKTDYILAASEHPDPTEQITLSSMSCDVRTSPVCEHAWAKGYRLTSEFYRGDRAMRESGFDTSFRFGPFSGSTHHYAPVCLNSLLYKYEVDMATMAHLLGYAQYEPVWTSHAAARKAAVNKYLWNAQKGLFYDFDYTMNKRSDYVYASTFYPLWAGLATPEQAVAVEKNLHLLEQGGGLASSNVNSGMQWDLPFGWAPLNYFAVEGLAKANDIADAQRVASAFMHTVSDSFDREGTIHEKYNVVAGNSDVKVVAGYKTNVVGFGWTNGVYLEFEKLVGTPVSSAGVQ